MSFDGEETSICMQDKYRFIQIYVIFYN